MFLKKLLFMLALAGAALNIHAEPLRYFGQAPESYQSAVPYGNNPETGKYVASDGANIYYEVYGQGEPIAVLHGDLVGSPAEMAQFVDVLRANRQVILVNTRGHGKSQAGADISYGQKARDLHAVLAALGVGKADLLGFSGGAYTALFFAAEYPEQTGRIVAIGAGAWKKRFRSFGSGDFAEVEKLDPAYWGEQQGGVRPEPDKTADWYRKSISYYNGLSLGKRFFRRISAPVLLLAGEKDQNAPLDTVLAAYRMLPNASLSIVAGAPHPVFLTNFDAVWGSVAPFLNAAVAAQTKESK